MQFRLKHTRKIVLALAIFSFTPAAQSQISLAFQGGEPMDTWSFTTSGADATALAQAALPPNVLAGNFALVAGGNTGGGSCIDGGSGNGPSVERSFTFNAVDISNSTEFTRTVQFNFGTRQPFCVGTGWDSGENLVFTPYYDGVAQPSITVVIGGNNANFAIQSSQFSHDIPPCVTSFYFHVGVVTNRRDELLFLDNVILYTPQLNTVSNVPTQVNLTICQNQLPFSWNGLTLNQAGNFTATLTNAFGCDSIVNLNLSVNNAVLPEFSVVNAICPGDPLSPLPTTSINGITGTWSPAPNNQTTTTYTFTPNAGQCASTSTLIITVLNTDPPQFNIVSSYCQGATIPALPTTSLNGISGSWSPAINNQQTTTYTFTPTGSGCVQSVSHTITIQPNETPQFNGVGSICFGAPIDPLPTNSLNGISGTWSPAPNNLQTTVYTFTPNGGTCAVSTTMEIEVLPIVTPSFVPIPAFCEGATINPLPTTSLNGILGQWSPALNNLTTTTYTFTPNPGACADPVDQTMTIINTVTTQQTVGVCSQDLPYDFYGQSLTQSGVYSATLTAASGCDSIIQLTLQVTQQINDVRNVQVCPENMPYDFYGQEISSTGSYSQLVSNPSGCDSLVVLHLTVLNSPQLDIVQAPIQTCQDPFTTTLTMSSMQNLVSATWELSGQTSTNLDGLAVSNLSEGCHDLNLTATDVFGCQGTLFVEDMICILPRPNASFSLESTSIETGDLITPNNLSENATIYVWDFGDESAYQSGFGPSHTYEEPGTFTITLVAVNEANCSDQFTQVVQVTEAELLYIPNSFTPNSNKLNDLFKPVISAGIDLQTTHMMIFNRQGELLFESYNPSLGWDGTYGGQPCMTGTYIWQFSYTTLDGLEKVIRGHVHLLR